MEAAINKVKYYQHVSLLFENRKKESVKSAEVPPVHNLEKVVETMLKLATPILSRRQTCFFCHSPDHFKRDCEKHKIWLKKNKGNTLKNFTQPHQRNSHVATRMDVHVNSISEITNPLESNHKIGNPVPQLSTNAYNISIQTSELDHLGAVTKTPNPAECAMKKPINKRDQNLTPKAHIQQTVASNSYVKLKLGGLPIHARVDTGSEVTILSTKVYEKLKRKPSILGDVAMSLASDNAVLKGYFIDSLKMKLGSSTFQTQYIAPIHDEMILGHDVLQNLGVIIDIEAGTLVVRGKMIKVREISNKDQKPIIARVGLSDCENHSRFNSVSNFEFSSGNSIDQIKKVKGSKRIPGLFEELHDKTNVPEFQVSTAGITKELLV
ncbi:uncharacterized protein LOC106155146 isoform X2 [Lingula anatina]|uniref:Uncharacterized protein LOC106155146 isoform X2 n=1 Tax=Lingula anatina TaxID=7574 RepID=A0A1S3HJW0_LINAN|nr:uncharacterized protein LOC106155146 isoform X2 [Lingula anatina]|eukprot:XP_013385279.1 uncharacterized protein LOC106155146 isoform X2 [Lingula anatina]